MESILAKVCAKHKELGRDFNEIEFRLGSVKGKSFQPDIGMVDFDAIVKRYKGLYPHTAAYLLTISKTGSGAGAEKNNMIVRLTDDTAGAEKIRAFCLSDGKITPEFEVYTKDKTSLDLDGYPIRVSFGEETPQHEVPNMSGSNFYRFARRFSFFLGGLGATSASMRLDCSVVKQGSGKDLKSSGVLDKTAEEFFEIELELSGFKGDLGLYKKELAESVQPLILKYQGGMKIAPSPVLVRALNDYFSTCKKAMSIGAGAPIEVQTVSPVLWDDATMAAVMKYYFLPDVPDVLSYDDYSKIGDSKEYCVTDKADGVRSMLYIATDGEGYIINKTSVKRKSGTKNALKIMAMDVSPKFPKGTLLDGELLVQGDRVTYMCFDIILGEGIRGDEVHFWDGRYKYLQDMFSKVPAAAGTNAKLALKQFIRCWMPEYQAYLNGNITRDRAGRLMYTSSNREHHYELDGLIFQKANDPYPAKGQKWYGTFKWKPLDQISVDFKLVATKQTFIPGEQIGLVGGKYLQLTPMYSAGQALKADPHSCYVPVVNGIPRTVDSDEPVSMGDIVECRMITSAQRPSYWQPMRLRRDKVFPNGEMAWKSNVASIMRPLTFEMLAKPPAAAAGAASDENIMRRINKVDRSISTEHIVKYGKDLQFPKVLEIAVGSGQSCKAWNLIRASEVLGSDIEPDIEANTALRNSYFLKEATYLPSGRKPVTNFYTADMTTLLHQPQINVDPGLAAKLSTPEKYDIAVCNFAIHYAFRSKQSLSNFLTNVSRNIKPGSYFVGSYMSGIELDRLMKAAPKTRGSKAFTTDGNSVSYRNGDVNLWTVKYTDVHHRDIYDNKVEVDIIKRPYSYEYWIDLSSRDVQKVFLEHGLEFVSDEQFPLKSDLDETDKIWVGVHHKYVFRKAATGVAATPEAAELASIRTEPEPVPEAPKKRVLKKKEKPAPEEPTPEPAAPVVETEPVASKKRVLKRKV